MLDEIGYPPPRTIKTGYVAVGMCAVLAEDNNVTHAWRISSRRYRSEPFARQEWTIIPSDRGWPTIRADPARLKSNPNVTWHIGPLDVEHAF